MFETEPTAKEPQDELFLERLETFMSKALDDVKAFAQREGRTYDEVCFHPPLLCYPTTTRF